MSGLSNTFDRFTNFMTGKSYMTGKERRAKVSAKKQKKIDKLYASAEMPDEELIRRNERRKAAKRRGSRISTVLTNDTLG